MGPVVSLDEDASLLDLGAGSVDKNEEVLLAHRGDII